MINEEKQLLCKQEPAACNYDGHRHIPDMPYKKYLFNVFFRWRYVSRAKCKVCGKPINLNSGWRSFRIALYFFPLIDFLIVWIPSRIMGVEYDVGIHLLGKLGQLLIYVLCLQYFLVVKWSTWSEDPGT